MKHALSIALCGWLVACASSVGIKSPQERALLVCEGWVAAEDKFLDRIEARLASPKERALVERHRPFLDTFCGSAIPVSVESTIASMEQTLLNIVLARRNQ